MQREYMTKVVPFLYSRGCKVWGWARHLVMNAIALFRPMMRQGTEGDMKTVLHKSCALVAQTFMLAMSEAGYDTCPVEGFDAHRVRKALGLPSSVEPSLIVSCGIRDEKRPLGRPHPRTLRERLRAYREVRPPHPYVRPSPPRSGEMGRTLCISSG